VEDLRGLSYSAPAVSPFYLSPPCRQEFFFDSADRQGRCLLM
jgi:hypothetical protein